MPTYRTAGIVLGRFNLGEADRIISFLTPDHGKLRAVARGVRRIKSRMAGHLELFNRVELMLATGRNLDVVTSARLQSHHGKLLEDYDRLTYAYLFAEIVDKLAPESQAHPELFELLDEVLAVLDRADGSALLELYFKLRLAAELGYRPQLEACVVCGKNEATASYWFSPRLGGIVDATCRQAEAAAMDLRQIKLWRLVLGRRYESLQQVEGAAEAAAAGLPITNSFYDEVFGRRFKAGAMK